MGGKLSFFSQPAEPTEDGSQPLEHLSQLLSRDGHHSEVLCWGYGSKCEFGMGEPKGPFRHPIVNQLLRGIPVLKVHAGAYHSYLVTEDRRVFGYGWNLAGQCGVGSQEETIKVPSEISCFRGVEIVLMASGAMHGHFVTLDGEFWSVGSNAFGQCGNNSYVDVRKPIRLQLPMPNESVRLLACGDFFTVVILGEIYAYAWGRNNHCQAGMLRNNCVPKPEICLALNRRCEDIVFLACGSDHTAVLTSDGSVSQFGSNLAKQFGQFLTTQRTPALTKISLGDSAVSHLAASGNVTTAIDTEGNLHVWGARHTLHNGTRTGLQEHPEVVWRCNEKEIRFLRMGRNHLHLLTRSGYLYTWVFAQWKSSPSPFFSKQYWTYYTQLYKERNQIKNDGDVSNVSLISPPETHRHKSVQRLNEEETQMEDIPLHHIDSDETNSETIEDMRPFWLEDGSSEEDDPPPVVAIGGPILQNENLDQQDEEQEEAEDSEYASQVSDIEQEQISETSSSLSEETVPHSHVKLPLTPWKSYYVGIATVKDLVCGAFTTQMLLYGNRFSSEFLPLALHPTEYFADTDLVLSDGSIQKVHKFFIKIRCPALIAKSTKKILKTSSPPLVPLIIKCLYYEYCIVSDLSNEHLLELKSLLRALNLKKSELRASIQSELAFRAHSATRIDVPRSVIDFSIRQFQQQLRVIYETQSGTDFQIFASLSLQNAPATPRDEESGTISHQSSILVHRAILAARCPFFKSLFRSNFSEHLSGFISLECSIDTLDHFLRYIYYNFTNFTVESATWILENSNLMFVDRLVRQPLRSACAGILRREGRRVQLKSILATLDPTFDVYEEGKALPDFVSHPAPASAASAPSNALEMDEIAPVASYITETPKKPRTEHRNRRRKKNPTSDPSTTTDMELPSLVDVSNTEEPIYADPGPKPPRKRRSRT